MLPAPLQTLDLWVGGSVDAAYSFANSYNMHQAVQHMCLVSAWLARFAKSASLPGQHMAGNAAY
eukprot:scaffold238316_cov17-Tisochrysis_lutea.AAC.1